MGTIDSSEKWTEIEHLPEWDEEFYDVYTAKKFGKWVMLKTLRPELKGREEYETILDREFEVRYNLAHSHIIMINDLEDVPGLGRCIITDDVYGDSLAKLIEKGEVTPEIVNRIVRDLPDAIDYLQTNHIVHYPIKCDTVIFTEKVRNLKVIDVGFDQKNELAMTDVTDDIRAFGHVLKAALDACPDCDGRLQAIAERCMGDNPYHNVQQLQMALSGSSVSRLYVVIIAFLVIMVAILSCIIIYHSRHLI